ncbi:MAG: threonine ammonia-lyase [Terrisporobacter sp.]|uniref:threonine ammonia-lyase n=1 Tax=Terrisporobacter sp. TaxID=1965305 RepID=UPI0039A1359C
MEKVTIDDIRKAQDTIKDIVKRTDILESTKLSLLTNANIYYKCENLQKTGSFKVRGACNKIANLTEEEKSKGVIASSAGNHAQGVALGAKMNNIEATIVMPSTAPLAKVTATKSYGANVVLEGLVYDDAYAKAVEIQKETGATFLHPFNDKYVIAGQGTIGLEIFEQMNNKVDTILCPIGGGGIIAGIATAAKALNPNVKIVGVQTANIPSMYESMKSGKVTTAFKSTSIADGISVKTVGKLTFNIAKDLLDEVVLVQEDEIAEAVLFLMENQKVVAEGSGAVTTAAILTGKYKPKENENVVLIISGGNIDVNTLNRIVVKGLINSGRRFSFITEIKDKPGGLAELTRILSNLDANIITANLSSTKAIGELSAQMTMETFDHEHIEKIKKAVSEAGFNIK